MKNYFTSLSLKTLGTLGIVLVSFTSIQAQYCEPAPAPDCAIEKINSVTFSTINNENFSCNTFAENDFTDQVAEVVPGQTYEMIVDVDADPDFPNDHIHFFIDWNQNEILDDEGEAYVLSDATGVSGTYTMDVTIPEDAEPGLTRLRVMIFYNGTSTYEPNPCHTSMLFGEVEDYSVEVGGEMSVNDLNSSNGISIYKSGSEFVVESKNSQISQIQIYDLTGKQISSQEQLNSSKVILNTLKSIKQVIVVKITTVDGKTLSKKLITH